MIIITILKIIPFALIGLAVLFGGHYLIYRSVINNFSIINPKIRLILLSVLLFLSLSFIISSALTRLSQGALTRYYYILSASWIGLALNLLLAIILIWAVNLLAKAIGINLNKQFFAGLIFSFAFLFSCYGVWNAFHPQVKTISIKLKNLPSQWQGKTIVQLSDVHLGNINSPNFMQGVAEKVDALNPDLILITGDLFDGMDGNLDDFVAPLNNLEAKDGIFFSTGNHETYLGLNRAFATLRQTKIKILDNEITDVNGLQIIGASYPIATTAAAFIGKTGDTSALIPTLKNFNPAEPSILMHHAPTDVEQAKAAGISLQLSGHVHNGQIFPIKFISRMIYGKYYYGLNQEGDFSIYTSGGTGTWGPPMRTGNTPEIVAIKID
jgi:hypothetical protein